MFNSSSWLIRQSLRWGTLIRKFKLSLNPYPSCLVLTSLPHPFSGLPTQRQQNICRWLRDFQVLLIITFIVDKAHSLFKLSHNQALNLRDDESESMLTPLNFLYMDIPSFITLWFWWRSEWGRRAWRETPFRVCKRTPGLNDRSLYRKRDQTFLLLLKRVSPVFDCDFDVFRFLDFSFPNTVTSSCLINTPVSSSSSSKTCHEEKHSHNRDIIIEESSFKCGQRFQCIEPEIAEHVLWTWDPPKETDITPFMTIMDSWLHLDVTPKFEDRFQSQW